MIQFLVVVASLSTLLDCCCWRLGAHHPKGPRVAIEIRMAVDSLDWNSLSMDHSGPSPREGSQAARLVELGTISTDALMEVLEDPHRGFAAHVALSFIWNCDHAYSAEMHFDEQGKLVSYTQEFDGLSWVSNPGGRESIELPALRENAKRWRARLGA